MKKKIKILLVAVISLPILFFIIEFALLMIEEKIEVNKYHIYVYNFTNNDIDITINDNIIKTMEGKTFVIDNIIEKYDNIKIIYLKIKINGKIILDEKYDYFDIAQSFSASGGMITEIEIHEINNLNYELIFLTGKKGKNEKESDWSELNLINRKYFRDIFNRDGLN